MSQGATWHGHFDRVCICGRFHPSCYTCPASLRASPVGVASSDVARASCPPWPGHPAHQGERRESPQIILPLPGIVMPPCPACPHLAGMAKCLASLSAVPWGSVNAVTTAAAFILVQMRRPLGYGPATRQKRLLSQSKAAAAAAAGSKALIWIKGFDAVSRAKGPKLQSKSVRPSVGAAPLLLYRRGTPPRGAASSPPSSSIREMPITAVEKRWVSAGVQQLRKVRIGHPL